MDSWAGFLCFKQSLRMHGTQCLSTVRDCDAMCCPYCALLSGRMVARLSPASPDFTSLHLSAANCRWVASPFWTICRPFLLGTPLACMGRLASLCCCAQFWTADADLLANHGVAGIIIISCIAAGACQERRHPLYPLHLHACHVASVLSTFMHMQLLLLIQLEGAAACSVAMLQLAVESSVGMRTLKLHYLRMPYLIC